MSDDAVRVRVNAVDVAFTQLTSTRVETEVPPPAGSLVEVYRYTAVEVPRVVFADAQIIRGADLNNADTQSRHRAEELGNELEVINYHAVKVPWGEQGFSLPPESERAERLPVFDDAGTITTMEGANVVVTLDATGKPVGVPVFDVLHQLGTEIMDGGTRGGGTINGGVRG